MDATDDVRRVTIRSTDGEVDVTLSAHQPIGDLLPGVVDLLGGAEFGGHTPHFTRICGQVLDPAVTLADHMVCDGELLILSAAARPAPVPRFDASTAVVAALDSLPEPSWWVVRRGAGWVLLGWAATVLAIVLGRTALDPNVARHPSVGAVAAVVALAGAVAVHRVHRDRAGAIVLGVLAAVFAGLTAALVPLGRPGLPAFLLAMSAIAATSLGAWRLLNCAPAVFVPLAAATMAASAVTTGAVADWWPTTAAGPMLATGSLAALALSAGLTVRSSGLPMADLSDASLEARARTAHRRLTALVVAAAGAAALGAAVTAATTTQPPFAAGFIAIVGTALALRTRHHDEPYRVAALAISSVVAATSLIGLSAHAAESSTPWVCVGLLLAAVGVTWFGYGGPARFIAVRRALSVLDLAVAAAVVPSACAAAGAFSGLTTGGLR